MRRLGSLRPRDSAAGRESDKGRETTTGAGSATPRPQLYFHADVSSPAGAFLVMWLAMVRISFSWVIDCQPWPFSGRPNSKLPS